MNSMSIHRITKIIMSPAEDKFHADGEKYATATMKILFTDYSDNPQDISFTLFANDCESLEVKNFPMLKVVTA